jgi:[protein-PII] uridylyltransferase
VAASVTARHAAAGDLAFLLEPDLKESRGGLRDLTQLTALAQVTPVLADLVAEGRLDGPAETLTAARVELHRATGRSANRLPLQDQDLVAAALGIDADQLAADLAHAGRTVAWASDDAWRRIQALLAGSRRNRQWAPKPIEPGLALHRGEVTLLPGADPATDPTLALRAGAVSAELDVALARETIDALVTSAPAPEGVWPEDLRQALLRILGAGRPAIAALETLDQQGVLERLLPEWGPVRNRPQRNAYHRYTVDRHLLEAVARAAEHLSEVQRPDLLVLGALLHDIGKGQKGDHSEVGTVIADTVMRRLGFPNDDVETVDDLVAFHLVLPEFATRRDIDDPSTIAVVARLAKDRNRLSLLAALVAADGQATGSAAWGTWKAELVTRLVEKVGVVLDGNPIPELVATAPTPEQAELLARRELAIRVAGRRVTVIAPDRPGLLAAVAGSLALNRCNVRRASAYEAPNGMAIELFDFDPAFDRPPDWAKIERDITAALDGTLGLGERLAEQERVYAPARRRLAAHPAAAQVTIDNKASERASIIEIRTPDRIGILYRIAAAVAELGLDVVAALVDTLGHEVIDTFYVREPDGGKLAGNARINAVREVLETVVHGAG